MRPDNRLAALALAAAAAAAASVLDAGRVHAFPWSKDLRRQPNVKTQEMPFVKVAGSVARDGAGAETIPDDPASDALRNPVPYSDASATRGAKSYEVHCGLCHGATAMGNGPVAAKFMPPPPLTGEHTRAQTDGWIYAHIRRGGPIMPPYRHALSAEQAWDLVNYIRQLQRKPAK